MRRTSAVCLGIGVGFLAAVPCPGDDFETAREVRQRVEKTIAGELRAAGRSELTKLGLPVYTFRGSTLPGRVTLNVIEPAPFDAKCVRALQRLLAKQPSWSIRLECRQTEGEPDLLVQAETVALDDEIGEEVAETVAKWHEAVDARRRPWQRPLYRQFDHCLPRIPELLETLDEEQPVVLVAAFDNHEGRKGRTNLWVLHRGTPFDIGLFGKGVKRPAHGRPDVRFDAKGRVTGSGAETKATLVQWLVEKPPRQVWFGPYTRLSPGNYDVTVPKWSIEFDPGEVLSDADLDRKEGPAQ